MLGLAEAANSGTEAVQALRAQATSPLTRHVSDQLLDKLQETSGTYISGLLIGAACAVDRARQRQSVDVVWTGPESGISTSRLTAATVVDLIGEAERDLLLVSFATQTEPWISSSLNAASARGVAIVLVTERHADYRSYMPTARPFPDLPALRLCWPAAERPKHAALHAKVIVVDDTAALVGSANLTGRAMEDNLECGILIRGGQQPREICEHVLGLLHAGHLRKL